MQPTNNIRTAGWLTPASTNFLLATAYSMTLAILLATALLMTLPLLVISAQTPARVQITPNEAARRVDVTIDGKPFTSYVYPTTIKKPVLWPIRSATGVVITRGFPLEPRPGERVDHPHHVGLWFNHGDVNGFDFWNNSEAIKPDQAKKYGTIVHNKTGEISSGNNRGELNVEMEWIGGDGVPLLRENTRFVFQAKKTDVNTFWMIDRITTLTALDKKVVFRDNKEGSLGLRVARALEQPADKPEIFTDASGKPTTVPVLDNKGVTGHYYSSERLDGDAVWGTRGRWTLLRGRVGEDVDSQVGIAILDHPSNPTHPAYWHARGYGLFSANVFGRKVFDPKQEELVITLEPGKSLTFKHRVLVRSGKLQPATVEPEYQAFIATPTSSR